MKTQWQTGRLVSALATDLLEKTTQSVILLVLSHDLLHQQVTMFGRNSKLEKLKTDRGQKRREVSNVPSTPYQFDVVALFLPSPPHAIHSPKLKCLKR